MDIHSFFGASSFKSAPIASSSESEPEDSDAEFLEPSPPRGIVVVRKKGKSLQRTGGAWITKPFNNWKKATEKMRAHSPSDVHMQSCEAELAATRAVREGSIIQQLQYVGEQEKLKNRTAIKALLRCTHFLARNHIAHN